jgi:hypothetical protein
VHSIVTGRRARKLRGVEAISAAASLARFAPAPTSCTTRRVLVCARPTTYSPAPDRPECPLSSRVATWRVLPGARAREIIMSTVQPTRLPDILARREAEILGDWLRHQFESRGGRVPLGEPAEQSREFLDALRSAVQPGRLEQITGSDWAAVRDILTGVAGPCPAGPHGHRDRHVRPVAQAAAVLGVCAAHRKADRWARVDCGDSRRAPPVRGGSDQRRA